MRFENREGLTRQGVPDPDASVSAGADDPVASERNCVDGWKSGMESDFAREREGGEERPSRTSQIEKKSPHQLDVRPSEEEVRKWLRRTSESFDLQSMRRKDVKSVRNTTRRA